jgi:hypothetical protein
VEAFGIEVRSHESSIGEAGFDVEFIDAVEVGLATGSPAALDRRANGMFALEVIAIAEEKLEAVTNPDCHRGAANAASPGGEAMASTSLSSAAGRGYRRSRWRYFDQDGS